MQVDSPLVTYAYEAVNYGGYHDPNIVVIHDVECPLKRGYARSLIGPAWFGGPAGTSTHYLVGPDDICQGVPENRIAWHCGTGNPRTLAIEQTGYASNSATDWDTPDGLIQQENVAQLLADINRRRPLIQLRTLSDDELRYAWNNPGTYGGVVTHDQMRRVIRGTTHHDPWNQPDSTVAYPLKRVISRAVAIRGSVVTKDWFDMATKSELKDAVREVLCDEALVTNLGSFKDVAGATLQELRDFQEEFTNQVYSAVWKRVITSLANPNGVDTAENMLAYTNLNSEQIKALVSSEAPKA